MENREVPTDALLKCLKDRREEMSDLCFQAISECLSGKPLTGPNGALNQLVSNLLNIALSAECESHIASTKDQKNRRNGLMPKVVESQFGDLDIVTPRDRNGDFDPQIIKKRELKLAEGLYEQILSLYATGMSTRDISKAVKDIYGVTLSCSSVSHVTNKLREEIESWKKRPLDPIYPVVWMDAVHYKVMQDGKSTTRAVYNILGIGMEGNKQVLGMYIDHSEGANYWRSVLEDLKDRGIKDIFIACVDGLTGFPAAITDIFPLTQVQLCIVHQLRNNAKVAGPKNRKAVVDDLTKIHKSPTIEAATAALEDARIKWGNKYPKIFESWDKNWNLLTTFYDFPDPLRNMIYTTNPVESYHSQLRRLTKTKGCFPNNTALEKMIYLRQKAAQDAWSKKPVQKWHEIMAIFKIKFGDRMKT